MPSFECLQRGLDRDARALDHLVDLGWRHVQSRHEAKRVGPWRVEEEPHVLPARMLLELVARVGDSAARCGRAQVEGAEQAEAALMREAELANEDRELLAEVGAGGGDSLEEAWEIGRASCRERGEKRVVAGAV